MSLQGAVTSKALSLPRRYRFQVHRRDVASKEQSLPRRCRFQGAVVSKALSLPRRCRFQGAVASKALSLPRRCRFQGAVASNVLFICKTKSRLRRRHCGLARHFKTDPTETVALCFGYAKTFQLTMKALWPGASFQNRSY
jgi:hypothetical protein